MRWFSLDPARIATVIVAVAGLSACKDSGLPDRNTPIDQAMNAESRYPLYDAADPRTDPAAVAFEFDGQRWSASGAAVSVPPRLLRTVGSTAQGQLHALVWDERPYTRLYIATADGSWRPVERT